MRNFYELTYDIAHKPTKTKNEIAGVLKMYHAQHPESRSYSLISSLCLLLESTQIKTTTEVVKRMHNNPEYMEYMRERAFGDVWEYVQESISFFDSRFNTGELVADGYDWSYARMKMCLHGGLPVEYSKGVDKERPVMYVSEHMNPAELIEDYKRVFG